MPSLAQLFWLQLSRLAATMHPALVAGYLAALEEIQKRFPSEEVERLVRAGDAAGVAAAVMSTATMQHAFIGFRTAIRSAIGTAAEYFAREVPPTRVGGHVLRVQFDVLAPDTVKAVRTYEAVVLRESGNTIKEAIVQAVEAGLEQGINPRTIARGIRDIVGLSPSQEMWVRNFRDELVRGDIKALERQLLDKRFISTIRKAFAGDGLTAEQIDTMVANYRRRVISYHAETTAHQIALNSLKIGKLEIWQQSVDQGVVTAEELEQTWRTRIDGKERDTHHDMNGITIPWGQRWHVPGVGFVRYPGEKEFNCRCVPIFGVKRKAAA
jgi:hypothetical protein